MRRVGDDLVAGVEDGCEQHREPVVRRIGYDQVALRIHVHVVLTRESLRDRGKQVRVAGAGNADVVRHRVASRLQHVLRREPVR